MSDETHELEFKKVRGRGIKIWRPKGRQPYSVAWVDGDGEPAYTATLTGDEPQPLDTVPIGDDEKGARETAQAVCQSHYERAAKSAAGADQPAGGLDWYHDAAGDHVVKDAAGELLYHCEADGSGGWDAWYHGGDDEAECVEANAETIEAAKARCQAHADHETETEQTAPAAGGLDWQYNEELETWTAAGPDDGTYIVEQESDGPDGGLWLAAIDGEELPDSDSAEAAKARCQQHNDTALRWRESLPDDIWVATSALLEPSEDYACVATAGQWEQRWTPEHCGDAIGEPTSLELAQEACQEHHREHAQAASVPPPAGEPPKRERGEWLIRQPPSPELLAVLAKKQAEAEAEEERYEAELVALARRYKAAKELITDKLGDNRELRSALGKEVRHGAQAKINCWRERAGEEWLYTDESGAELYREAVADGEQLRLPSGGKAADKPPEPVEEPAGDAEEPAESLASLAMAELVKQGVTMADPSADEAEPPATVEFPRGKTISSCGRYSLRKERGLWVPCLGVHGGLELPRAGAHKAKADAVAQCQQHLDAQIRWGKPVMGEDGDPCMLLSVPVEGRPQYQLVRQVPDDSGRNWQAERIGGQDEDNTPLEAHNGLEAAKERCQKDADELTREAYEQQRAEQ